MPQITTHNTTRARNFLVTTGDDIAKKYLIYITGRFDYENTTELIGNLGAIVANLPQKPIYTQKSEIVSPYDIDKKNPYTDEDMPTIIDIFIDSNGGDTHVLHDLSTLLSMAKMRGAIIRTTVMSAAYSCGSLLAIQGTPGYRIMSQNAEHLVHYGRITTDVYSTAHEELATQEINLHKERLFSKYERYTNIPKRILNEAKRNRIDKILDAQKCLEYGICDWILNENGTLQGRRR